MATGRNAAADSATHMSRSEQHGFSFTAPWAAFFDGSGYKVARTFKGVATSIEAAGMFVSLCQRAVPE
jgi:hypothetical protein